MNEPRMLVEGKSFEVPVKRFHVPGACLATWCPKCEREVLRDFGTFHLSYPTANTPIDVDVCCPHCEHEWAVRCILNVSLAVAP